MDAYTSSKRETDALIEAIWGPKAADRPEAVDAVTRAAQNHALAEAIKAYLQAYLSDAHGPAPPRLDSPGPVS